MTSSVVGVIGLGSAGLRHAKLLAARDFKVVALRSGLGPTVHRTPESIVETRTMDDFLALKPSFCVVASPTHLHLSHVSSLIEERVPVLVEKPLIGSPSALADLNARSKFLGVPIVVGYHLRFHPGLIRVQEQIAAGLLGRPLIARVAWGEYLPDWHPGEDFRRSYVARADQDGGPLSTLSHTLDYCIRLFGAIKDSQILSLNLGRLGIDVPEVTVVNLHHVKGALSSISLDLVTQPAQHKIEISGSDGFVSFDFQSSEYSLRGNAGRQAMNVNFGDSISLRMKCFSRQLDDFVRSFPTLPGGLSSHDFGVATAVSELHYAQPFFSPHK